MVLEQPTGRILRVAKPSLILKLLNALQNCLNVWQYNLKRIGVLVLILKYIRSSNSKKLTNEINKNKSLSFTGEKEDHLKNIVSNYDKMEQMKARQLDVKEILQGSKKEKDQEEVKEEIKPKQQNRGYELR